MAASVSKINLFGGDSKPGDRFWRFVKSEESESGENELWFHGYISEYSWFEDEISPAQFRADLERVGQGGPVTVRIHSGGGEVFAASAIRSILVEYPGRVTTRIDGLCASAATFVALAGDRVLAQDTSYFMIHNPWSIAWGDAAEFESMARFLGVIKDGIVDSYQNKTGADRDQISAWMDAETWFTAEEAVSAGFVDEVISTKSKVSMSAVANALMDFSKVPVKLQAYISALSDPAAQGDDLGAEKRRQIDQLAALVQILKT